MRFLLALQLVTTLSLTACAGGAGGGGSNSGNDNGSSPINAQEERDYKRAINKCYKTGGSRVVKVEGQLMCY
jgi:hypothetical protein